jgi:hypothetical protein
VQREPNETRQQLGELRRASPQLPWVVWAGDRINEDYPAWEGTRAPTGP